MSKISKSISNISSNKNETSINYMGGTNYNINPLDTLKIVTSSSIFGEPSYYRDGSFGICKNKINDGYFKMNYLLSEDLVMPNDFKDLKTSEIMEKVIDEALDYDFEGVLRWAVECRKDFNMRLNPQVIMVRAAIHEKRKLFTSKHPGMFAKYQNLVMQRADEPASQLSYYIFKKGSKNKIPTILKNSIGSKLSKLSKYEINKYKNHEVGMINAIRITHATSEPINSLMNSNLNVSEEELTWENLRSKGMDWKTIYETIDIKHMALLRNIRGVFEEVNDIEFCEKYLEKLKSGVLNGKQFPFRYYNAYLAVEKNFVNFKSMILEALSECVNISNINTIPKLKGRVMCLSDNSGSAWESFNSEYGRVTIAEINNLSATLIASNSDDGYVGKFGDELKTFSVKSNIDILSKTKEISTTQEVGKSTEGGIWEFFKNAIQNKELWDHIFIYSDQQAGHGNLYGTCDQIAEYENYRCNDYNINVFKLIKEYREKVNPKVNVYSIQTAGYTNMVIPQNAYRTSIMYGWTGKESIYAQKINQIWNEIDSR